MVTSNHVFMEPNASFQFGVKMNLVSLMEINAYRSEAERALDSYIEKEIKYCIL
jgi:hypothetical protein